MLYLYRVFKPYTINVYTYVIPTDRSYYFNLNIHYECKPPYHVHILYYIDGVLIVFYQGL